MISRQEEGGLGLKNGTSLAIYYDRRFPDNFFLLSMSVLRKIEVDGWKKKQIFLYDNLSA